MINYTPINKFLEAATNEGWAYSKKELRVILNGKEIVRERYCFKKGDKDIDIALNDLNFIISVISYCKALDIDCNKYFTVTLGILLMCI